MNLERRLIDYQNGILLVRTMERGEDGVGRIGDGAHSRFEDPRIGRISPVDGANVAVAGEIVEVKSGGRVGA